MTAHLRLRLLASAGGALNPVYVLLCDRVEAALHAELEEAAFSVAWREGDSMVADGEERVVAYAVEPVR